MSLGLNIKKLRIKRSMTQEDLADLLNTTVKSISRWENETTYPDITILPLLANIFETTVDELLDVEKVKMDEYLVYLNEKAFELQKNNDLYTELKLWKEEYKKFPHSEQICIRYAQTMQIVNVIENKVVYNEELVKILDRLVDKTSNRIIYDNAIQILVDLNYMLDNITKADFYAKKLTDNIYSTYDVVKTRYLKDDELLIEIQQNTFEFISEINREAEFVIFNNRLNLPIEYRKEYLEKIIKINEVLFEENDYGYDVSTYIFNNIGLARMIIETTNEESKILECFRKIKEGIKYILEFKVHNIKSPLLCKIKCEHIGSYSKVLLDMKKNVLNQLSAIEFNEYQNKDEYLELIEMVNLLK